MKRTIVNPVIKDTVTFLQTSAESGGTLTEAEITLMPGGGNPLHYHKTYSETFTAVVGDLGLNLARNVTRILKPGESYTVDPMALHRFFNPTGDEIKFRVRIIPGQRGLENSLRILYGLATDGLTDGKAIPKSLRHTAIILCMSDMNVPGLLTFLFPILKWMAARAKASGEEQRLVERYCV